MSLPEQGSFQEFGETYDSIIWSFAFFGVQGENQVRLTMINILHRSSRIAPLLNCETIGERQREGPADPARP